MMPRVSVSVLVLNYRSRWCLTACLEALKRQTWSCLEVIFMDNASGDGSVEFVRRYYPDVKVLAFSRNLYYCRAHNLGIERTKGEYVLLLNADIILTPTYIEEMVKAAELDPQVGMVSGKLLRMDRQLNPLQPPRIDSAGLWFSRQMRHFDRGADVSDQGQYDRPAYIFGPSGAAPLYRRSMLDDIRVQGEYFDEAFVIYREDADLAWRAQLLGWRALYTPAAVGYHLRGLRPEHKRRRIPALLNMHSVKNRFLMRIKNQTRKNLLRFALPSLRRDILVVGYVVLAEHRSLPALAQVLKLLPATLAKRRIIMKRRRVDDCYMAAWFADREIAFTYQQTDAIERTLENRHNGPHDFPAGDALNDED